MLLKTLSFADYLKVPGVNWSTLKHLAKSPAHYRQAVDNPGDDTDPRKLGRATHLATLEPERFRSEVVVWEETRRGKEWLAFQAANVGREILTRAQHTAACAISNSVKLHPLARKHLARGDAEVSLSWRWESKPLDGFAPCSFDCKGRIDWLAEDGTIVDLKSTRDASPEGFQRECVRYGYHAQLAMYRDGLEAAAGIVGAPVVIVAVENFAPYVVQVYRVGEDALRVGRAHYRDLLARLNVCQLSGEWPGYSEGELPLVLPAWAQGVEDEEDDQNTTEAA